MSFLIKIVCIGDVLQKLFQYSLFNSDDVNTFFNKDLFYKLLMSSLFQRENLSKSFILVIQTLLWQKLMFL